MEKKYRILRLIGTIFKILGVISAVITIISGLGICVMSVAGTALYENVQDELGMVINGAVAGVVAGGLILLYGVISALMLYGLGEGIFLLISLEENTRRTAYYMSQYSSEPVVPEV